MFNYTTTREHSKRTKMYAIVLYDYPHSQQKNVLKRLYKKMREYKSRI